MRYLDTLRLCLLPLVPVYAAAARLRNFLFDTGILKSARAGVKVVSVGNLTVGGSGKTPLVMYLCGLFTVAGLRAGVLSRGYGRKSKGYRLVFDGKLFHADVEEAGDEIYQTALDNTVPAAVAEDRVSGAKQFLRDVPLSLILLDDAFQHRWIQRDCDIVVLEQRFLTEAGRLRRMLLPTGNLREPFSSLHRADIIVVNRKFSKKALPPDHLRGLLSGKKVFDAYYAAEGLVDIKRSTAYAPQEFKGQVSLVVSGIASPHSLFDALEQIGVRTGNRLVFRDHKDYTAADIARIRKTFYATNSYCVITTHKDAVKLMQYKQEFDDIDIYYLKISMAFDDAPGFSAAVLQRVQGT